MLEIVVAGACYTCVGDENNNDVNVTSTGSSQRISISSALSPTSTDASDASPLCLVSLYSLYNCCRHFHHLFFIIVHLHKFFTDFVKCR